MTTDLGKRLRLLLSALSLLALAAAGAGIWFHAQLRASLPRLDGTQPLAGLTGRVTVTRDALGVPSVRGGSRVDVARALGFLHAQDRFFQMDTLRRRAAGELAEVFGKAALPSDRRTRPHHFRALAAQVLAALPAEDRTLLESYAAGTNAGLTALRRPPFEYVVLRTTPAPWTAVDSLLVIYAMTLELQDSANTYEQSLATLRDQFGNAGVAFFAPLLTPQDAAIDGSTGPLAPVPAPGVLRWRPATPAAAHEPAAAEPSPVASGEATDPELRPGSNSFAVTGAHTRHHGALLANDPHLHLGLPNLWYRALLAWPSGESAREVVGVTIPGLPFIVLGSNGRIAWGLTDAYADTSDLVAVEAHPESADLYRVPGRSELQTVELRQDTIEVKGGKAEKVESRWTAWGPIVGTDGRGRPLANHWVAYDPTALNFEFARLEEAGTVAEAIAVAHRCGIPAHNFLVADSAGDIGWTIVGRLPQRIGFDGRLPVSWIFGDRRWDGFVPTAEVPSVLLRREPTAGNQPLAPLAAAGVLWTANNRVVGGPALARIGDGGYAPGARAAQLRDDLARLAGATPRDFLAIQLDDRAVFLERWQRLLLATLSAPAVEKHRDRGRFRALAAAWEGRATVGSVSYRLVRAFRERTARLVFEALFERCREANPAFSWREFNYEPALWSLVEQRPAHLLPPPFQSWDDLLLAAVDHTVTELAHEGVEMERATWGQANRASIGHPFGQLWPAALGWWLNLPPDPLPGDRHMPRIQSPVFGASMRMVVAPGHENEGLFEMPGGQSGHPLSPFFRAGHEQWVRGEPAPLLPGPVRHTLVLVP